MRENFIARLRYAASILEASSSCKEPSKRRTSLSAARAERLKAEVAALPKQEVLPFELEWKAVQEEL